MTLLTYWKLIYMTEKIIFVKKKNVMMCTAQQFGVILVLAVK